MQLHFKAISEAQPDAAWQGLFQEYWPAYRAWFVQRNGQQNASLKTSQDALQQHMPELVPVYRRLVELSGNDPLAAQLLTLYCPPPYLVSCSQAALVNVEEPVLVRNYDLDPRLNEGLILHSEWAGRTVMASSEFLWGVADGINDAGLAVSLAFGGRKVVGQGFGIPLILRYVLQVCDSVPAAIAVLSRIPSHMAYNVTLLDAKGEAVTVQLAPHRSSKVVPLPVATNHQGQPQWDEHARFTATVEREQYLRKLLSNTQKVKDFVKAFAQAPLYNKDYSNGFGTLYTAVYRPQTQQAEWRWPNAIWQQSLADFKPGQRLVNYSSKGAEVAFQQPAFAIEPEAETQTAPTGFAGKGTKTATLEVLRQAFSGQPWLAHETAQRFEYWYQLAQQSDDIPWHRFGQIFSYQN